MIANTQPVSRNEKTLSPENRLRTFAAGSRKNLHPSPQQSSARTTRRSCSPSPIQTRVTADVLPTRTGLRCRSRTSAYTCRANDASRCYTCTNSNEGKFWNHPHASKGVLPEIRTRNQSHHLEVARIACEWPRGSALASPPSPFSGQHWSRSFGDERYGYLTRKPSVCAQIALRCG